MFKHKGDFGYNLFAGTVRRARETLSSQAPSLSREVPRILKTLGIKAPSQGKSPAANLASLSFSKSAMSTYYGQLVDFAWHNISAKHGAHFAPIYSLIEHLQKKYPNDLERLQVIRRRLLYLEVLRIELEDIEGIYDLTGIPLLPDWLANKVETLATLSAEVALVITEYYREKTTGKHNSIRFEDLVDELPKNSPIFDSINTTLDGFLAVSIRNEMVHSTGFRVQVTNGQGRVSVTLQRNILRFGLMQSYLQTDVLSKICASVVGTERRDLLTFFIYQDHRFPYVTFAFPRSKKGTASINGVEARYNLSVRELAKMENDFLFILARELFSLC